MTEYYIQLCLVGLKDVDRLVLTTTNTSISTHVPSIGCANHYFAFAPPPSFQLSMGSLPVKLNKFLMEIHLSVILLKVTFKCLEKYEAL